VAQPVQLACSRQRFQRTLHGRDRVLGGHLEDAAAELGDAAAVAQQEDAAAVGELEESEQVLRQGVTLFPEHAALRVFLAFTRWTAEDRGGAMRELVEALLRADAPGMSRYERSIRGYSAEL